MLPRTRTQMEVGIEDCLHIEFEYDRARYHLRDVVVGKIYFLLVSRMLFRHVQQSDSGKPPFRTRGASVPHMPK